MANSKFNDFHREYLKRELESRSSEDAQAYHLLRPFEITLEDAARRLYASLYDPEGLTEANILEGLKKAVRAGELNLKRGTVTEYPWPTFEPIIDAIEACDWLEGTGLEIDWESDGLWRDFLEDESNIQMALDDRLRALRAMESMKVEANPGESPPNPASIQDNYMTLLKENIGLKRQLAERNQPEIEPDPRHRKTLLRIIGALLAETKMDEAMTPTAVGNAINSRLEAMGQKPLDPKKTIAPAIKDARHLANEMIE